MPALTRGAVAIALPTALMLMQRTTVLSAAGVADFPYTDNPMGSAAFRLGRLTAVRAQVGWIIPIDPALAPLRNDPSFQRVLARRLRYSEP